MKMSPLTWNDKFELPDEVYLISDIQDYFQYVLKNKHGENIDNPSIRIYINKIENRITLKFVFNKSFGSLLEISPKKIYLFKNI